MFKSQLLILNRWRLEHQLPNLNRTTRWIVWDITEQKQMELLSVTATEMLTSEQPNHFIDVHSQSQHCVVHGMEHTYPFAIYPIPTSEFTLSKGVPSHLWEDFIAQVVHALPNRPCLSPQEIVLLDTELVIRPFGETTQFSRIGVNPLHPPSLAPNIEFSIAMMVILSHHPDLSWDSPGDFTQWLSTVNASTLLPTLSPLYIEWVQKALTMTPTPNLPISNTPLRLSPIDLTGPTSPKASTQQMVSHASKDIPLPKYLIVAPKIASPSVAKQLAAIAGIHPDPLCRAYDRGSAIPIDGAKTHQEAEELLRRYSNVPITLSIQPSTGPLGTSGLSYGLHIGLLSGLGLTVAGLGWIPLALGTGLWLSGQFWKSSHKSTQHNRWKESQQVGVTQQRELTEALQGARRRILLSDMPELAIRDMMTQLDMLEESASTNPQMAIDTANQMVNTGGTLSNALKKSMQDTEDLVKSSLQ